MIYNFLANDPNQVDPIKVLIAIGIMLFISVVFGFLIMVVSKKFAVETDEREDAILNCLAGANCGGCGRAGCGAFSHALVEGKGEIDDCPVTSKDNKIKIAEVLGVDYAGGASYKYVVACNGGDNAVDVNTYVGEDDCVRQNMTVGGRKACATACLGAGTCAVVCKSDAIKVENGVAKIDQSLCIRCGACAKGCPKSVIKKIDAKAKIYVACSTNCRGKDVMAACKMGCIGCGLCAKNCPYGAITMVNNLPVIDYSKCQSCYLCVEKCPRKVILKID